MWKLLVFFSTTVTGSLFSTYTFAGDYQFVVGGGGWNASTKGTIGNTDPALDLSQLGIKKDTQEYYFGRFEHPWKYLPFIEIGKVNYGHNAEAVTPTDLDIDSTVFPEGAVLKTHINLDYTEGTLYYPLINDIVRLDIGVTARRYDGGLKFYSDEQYVPVEPSGATEEINTENLADETDTGQEPTPIDPIKKSYIIDGIIPLLYLEGKLKLPRTNWYVAASTNHIAYTGNRHTDWELRTGYHFSNTLINVGLEAGYKKVDIKLKEQNELDSDFSYDGFFIGVVIGRL